MARRSIGSNADSDGPFPAGGNSIAARCSPLQALAMSTCALLHRFAYSFGLLITLAGCGAEAGSVGQVFGKVTYRGQPVTEGTIALHSPEAGYGAEAQLGTDGSYRFAGGVTPGEYQVSVYPPVVIDNSDPRTPPVSVYKKVESIPPKYHLPGTSELKATVKEGDNPLDFNLK
jgi:hypothetical protein